jgi:mRNA interferase RelE/StbE
MSWTVIWSDGARSDLADLDKSVARRVIAAVERLASKNQGRLKKLEGSDRLRLRVGDWRVIFRRDSSKKVLRIERVGHRSEVYR